MKTNNLIQLFFNTANQNFILNVLHVLELILLVPQHRNRLEEIFYFINTHTSDANISLEALLTAVNDAIVFYKNNNNDSNNFFMKKHTKDAAMLKKIDDTKIYWFFLALFWGYDFNKHKSKHEIVATYNWQIGDIALKFLLYFLKMEQKKLISGKSIKKSFYKDVVPILIRIIDILIVFDNSNNDYIKQQYLPKNEDLALNFFNIHIDDPWKNNLFSKVQIKTARQKKSILQFYYAVEDIELNINLSRMQKENMFNNFENHYRDLMDFYNTNVSSKSSKYHSRIKTPKLNSEAKVSKTRKEYPLVEFKSALFEELIYEKIELPLDADADTKAEAQLKAKAYARHIKPLEVDDEQDSDNETFVIPNGFVQNKRNRAFSSNVTKQNLLLESDYHIPPIGLLKEFIVFLQEEV